jgi:hypothetical protein
MPKVKKTTVAKSKAKGKQKQKQKQSVKVSQTVKVFVSKRQGSTAPKKPKEQAPPSFPTFNIVSATPNILTGNPLSNSVQDKEKIEQKSRGGVISNVDGLSNLVKVSQGAQTEKVESNPNKVSVSSGLTISPLQAVSISPDITIPTSSSSQTRKKGRPKKEKEITPLVSPAPMFGSFAEQLAKRERGQLSITSFMTPSSSEIESGDEFILQDLEGKTAKKMVKVGKITKEEEEKGPSPFSRGGLVVVRRK